MGERRFHTEGAQRLFDVLARHAELPRDVDDAPFGDQELNDQPSRWAGDGATSIYRWHSISRIRSTELCSNLVISSPYPKRSALTSIES